ncbi:auxin-responsive protein SAUR72-like protein [Cinnamomum micranthum f. kanehirae]|uniref:Auxin-responsive protein SAUR72-like protein n=1 Tax=Cinnamomum micranthum f. kanehirae TaxID=337451 RepID=A0A443N9K5_9MAGN|nr:auxin-responsive protein SAUR72-like protein [Cinnamomum micranthum f. kanehirae]
MDQKKANKISDIVRLQQILKKWRKLANTPKPGGSKSMKFLKKTLSFSDGNSSSALVSAVTSDVVPKGFLAVCVGEEMKRFIIPTEYLGHRAFGILLKEAEEEFGFQHEGVLRIPCEVSAFEKILKVVEEKREVLFMHELGFNGDNEMNGCCSSQAEICQSHRPPKPICR